MPPPGGGGGGGGVAKSKIKIRRTNRWRRTHNVSFIESLEHPQLFFCCCCFSKFPQQRQKITRQLFHRYMVDRRKFLLTLLAFFPSHPLSHSHSPSLSLSCSHKSCTSCSANLGTVKVCAMSRKVGDCRLVATEVFFVFFLLRAAAQDVAVVWQAFFYIFVQSRAKIFH